jgi:hypothetical protein
MALVRTDVLEEHSTSIFMVTSMHRLLVTATYEALEMKRL